MRSTSIVAAIIVLGASIVWEVVAKQEQSPRLSKRTSNLHTARSRAKSSSGCGSGISSSRRCRQAGVICSWCTAGGGCRHAEQMSHVEDGGDAAGNEGNGVGRRPQQESSCGWAVAQRSQDTLGTWHIKKAAGDATINEKKEEHNCAMDFD